MILDDIYPATDESAAKTQPSSFKRATGNEIRSSLPPYIQKKIKKTQEIRKRKSYDPKTGMIHGGSGSKHYRLNPLRWIKSLFKGQ